MAVQSVTELFLERSGDEDDKGRSFKRVFHVTMTEATTYDQKLILDNEDIPQFADAFPDTDGDVLAIVTKRSCKPFTDNVNWKVTVTYTPVDLYNMEWFEHPWDIPPEISVGHVGYNRVIDKAFAVGANDGGYDDISDDSINGDSSLETRNPSIPIQNSARDSFDPPIQQEEYNTLIIMVKNHRHWDPNNAGIFNNTINMEDIRVAGINIPKYQGRLRKYSGDRKVSGSDIYWQVSYEIEVDKKTHIRKILDQGFYEGQWDGSTWVKTPILKSDLDSDYDGSSDDGPVEDPQKLYIGVLMSETQEEEGAYYRQYQTYYAADWSVLEMPEESASYYETIET